MRSYHYYACIITYYLLDHLLQRQTSTHSCPLSNVRNKNNEINKVAKTAAFVMEGSLAYDDDPEE